MSRFRILSYNVHSCIGIDKQHSPDRIARVIASCSPDIVALQEIDVGRERTGGVDQAHMLASMLGMKAHFNASTHVGPERYGDAILTALPISMRRTGQLPGFHDRIKVEPRGALWASIEVGNRSVQVVNTHLGVWPHEQMLQLSTLLGPDWLGHPDCHDPVVFLGDFNAPPGLSPYRRLASEFTDVQKVWGERKAKPTFPGRMPTLRIDHVWLRGRADIENVEVVRTPLARVASDHLPLVVDLDIHAGATRQHGKPRPAHVGG
ncbi:endonuclease/exonuclease/phosphatase family protein [Kaistia dalseonensis]|uniref:Endonuclease/exonuclease/phosphatase family metal-dependent hydrolase n=1 Tax=Kaistia dalseonensis TaxID=410840 RepID=A0ABU0H220_9HYPH|nr:endonuclease/exonuclease/phosphatase family protein [Kaistia dalseonensis]MCX5493786.1 endonuclease/exonuclease/phosphatase family protein [Kaistia dalseonensis]MDQ0436350.1 endonuclease/exonuclease/phosphatase family metal-dependent hydrolase [Kaistia dalseonensis]